MRSTGLGASGVKRKNALNRIERQRSQAQKCAQPVQAPYGSSVKMRSTDSGASGVKRKKALDHIEQAGS